MAKSDKKTKKSKASKSGKKAKAKAKGRFRKCPRWPRRRFRNPAHRRVLLHGAGRGALCRAHRPDARRYRAGQHAGRCVHALRHALGRGPRLPGKLANLPDKPRHGFAILVNSGNANTFTGARGVRDVDVIAEATAQAVGVPAEHVFTSSTGVIGNR
jgi:hypothetical protein